MRWDISQQHSDVIFQCLFFFQFRFISFYFYFIFFFGVRCLPEREIFFAFSNLVNKSLSSSSLTSSIAFFITTVNETKNLHFSRDRAYYIIYVYLAIDQSRWRSHKKKLSSIQIPCKTYHWPSFAFFLCHNDHIVYRYRHVRKYRLKPILHFISNFKSRMMMIKKKYWWWKLFDITCGEYY